MPQPILPLFSDDQTIINDYMAVQKKGDTVYWFQGQLPVFCHHVANEQLFRLFCSQMINIGTATSAQISRALGVNREKLSRWAREDRSSNPSESQLASNVSASPSKKKPMS